MYIANVTEDGFENNPYLDAVRDYATGKESIVIPLCNQIEAEIAQLDEEDKKDFLAEMDMEEAGLDQVIRGGYDLLDMQTYFTAGVKKCAWTVAIGATAPQAAA